MVILKNKNRIALSLVCAGLVFWACDRAIHKVMHGFTVHDLYLDPPSSVISPCPPENLRMLLDQPFHFYDYGGESYIFISQDESIVLKLFKNHRLSTFNALYFLKNIPFLKSSFKDRERLNLRFWKSFQMQLDPNLKDLSEIIYGYVPHLESASYPVTLTDPIHITHKVDLAHVPFLIQKKGELFVKVFEKADSREQKEQLLNEAIHFYHKLYVKGLKLWDMAPKRNLGYSVHGPFLIDTGSLAQLEKQETFAQVVKKFEKWVSRFHPDYREYLLHCIATSSETEQ